MPEKDLEFVKKTLRLTQGDDFPSFEKLPDGDEVFRQLHHDVFNDGLAQNLTQ